MTSPVPTVTVSVNSVPKRGGKKYSKEDFYVREKLTRERPRSICYRLADGD